MSRPLVLCKDLRKWASGTLQSQGVGRQFWTVPDQVYKKAHTYLATFSISEAMRRMVSIPCHSNGKQIMDPVPARPPPKPHSWQKT